MPSPGTTTYPGAAQLGPGQLAAALDRLLRASVAPSSMQLYHRAWDLFRQAMFASSGLLCETVILPLSVPQVSIFVAFLHTQNLAPSSMVSYTSALGYVHRLLGYEDPTSATLIQKLLAGATKIAPTVDPRLPITIIILHRLCGSTFHHIKSPYHQVLLRAMFCTAFFGLMRLAEITVTKQGQVIINLSQLTLTSQLAVINITHFKHNNSLKPVDVPLCPQQSNLICPVLNLAAYLQVRGFPQAPCSVFQGVSLCPGRFLQNIYISSSGLLVMMWHATSRIALGSEGHLTMLTSAIQMPSFDSWGDGIPMRLYYTFGPSEHLVHC